jgi:hypothetical protein
LREIAIDHARRGELSQSDGSGAVTVEEVERALGDLYRLTEGGIVS